MRITSLIPWAGLLICSAGAFIVHLPGKRIARLAGLFLIYLGGSILLLTACSFQTCLALLVCGIGSAVLLGTGNFENRDAGRSGPSENRRKVLSAILMLMLGLVSYTLTERIRFWIPVRRTVLFAAVWVFLTSLIDLAMEDDLLYRSIFLQCICLSFTMVYIYMESSILVFACFAAINLLMAFGSSILTSGHIDDKELKETDI